MNQLIATGVTMTSREISELVESRHDNVRVAIERLAKKGIIQLPPMQEVKDNQSLSPNNKTSVYVFSGEQGKRDSIIVVAQLSPEFTARLVDRWQELESRLNAPLTPELQLANAILLAGRMIEEQKFQIGQRDKMIADLSPKAQIADRLNGAEGNLTIRNTAKALKMKEHKFTDWLQIKHFAFRNKKGKLEGYSDHVPRYLDHKVHPIPTDGEPDRVSFQMMITPEGLVKFAKMLNVELNEQEFDFQEAA